MCSFWDKINQSEKDQKWLKKTSCVHDLNRKTNMAILYHVAHDKHSNSLVLYDVGVLTVVSFIHLIKLCHDVLLIVINYNSGD